MSDSFSGAGSRRRGSEVRGGTPPVRPGLERLECRDLLTPLAPTNLVATGVSASAIALAWKAPADPTVTAYDLYEHVWVPGVHDAKGSGGTPGHYVYNLIANDLTLTSDTIAGLAAGSTHDYVVTALSPSGQSAYSLDSSAETWIAPGFPNGPSAFLLSGGALYSGTVNATTGMTPSSRSS